MKISIQWILAAIIVILLLLVGAYALTNGNNTPAANVTATPTTTPTATVVASPSVTPSTAATATPAATASPAPTATPTISGANGVKLTDFGYYITYPPFSENEINVNPNYVASQGNAVYFSPTSDSITVDNTPVATLDAAVDEYNAHAIIHRSGDTSGTVNATIHIALTNEDSNIIDDWDLDYSVVRYDSSSGDYIVTFGPGETQKDIGIIIYPGAFFGDASAQQVSAPEPMTLTITNVDGGFSIGSGNVYTLNVYSNIVNPTPNPDVTVSFQDASATYFMGTGNMYDQHVDLVRTGDPTNYLTVNVILDQITEDVSSGYAVTFDAGSYTATYYYTVYGKGVDVQEPDVYTYHIEPDSAFTVVTPGTFTVYDTYWPPT